MPPLRWIAYPSHSLPQCALYSIKAANRTATLVLCGRRHLHGLAELFRAAKDDVSVYDIYDYKWYGGLPIEGAEGIIAHEREDDGT
jgi:hypothetical protein